MSNVKNIKSPGRKAMSKSLKGKPAQRPRWVMKNVPQAIECDLAFYKLYCESKDLEEKLDEKSRMRLEDVFAAMRKRWAEVMAPRVNDVGSPVQRLIGLLQKGQPS